MSSAPAALGAVLLRVAAEASVPSAALRCDGEARGAAARPDASLPWLRVAAELG